MAVVGTVGANYPAMSIGWNTIPTAQGNVTRLASLSVVTWLVGQNVIPQPQFNVTGIKTGAGSAGGSGTVGYGF